MEGTQSQLGTRLTNGLGSHNTDSGTENNQFTAAEITPIRSVDGRVIGEGVAGPIIRQMQKLFFGLFDGSTPDEHGWLEYV